MTAKSKVAKSVKKPAEKKQAAQPKKKTESSKLKPRVEYWDH